MPSLGLDGRVQTLVHRLLVNRVLVGGLARLERLVLVREGQHLCRQLGKPSELPLSRLLRRRALGLDLLLRCLQIVLEVLLPHLGLSPELVLDGVLLALPLGSLLALLGRGRLLGRKPAGRKRRNNLLRVLRLLLRRSLCVQVCALAVHGLRRRIHLGNMSELSCTPFVLPRRVLCLLAPHLVRKRCVPLLLHRSLLPRRGLGRGGGRLLLHLGMGGGGLDGGLLLVGNDLCLGGGGVGVLGGGVEPKG
mmetsp:Transcript_33876/g.79359  ORF Transcript_33876/g.79359 Transcript_33876/m.79359 type:complete len:249 (-) Transcript_33876:300-1046(-)